MSEDNVALAITVGFFVWMAGWGLLVECCGRKLRGRSERKAMGQVAEMKRDGEGKKGGGYETAVVLVMAAAVSSLVGLGLPGW
jgi:hypothetical protein